MSDSSRAVADSLFQQPTPGPDLGPTNRFIKFKKEEIEQSIPDRFEQMVAKYPNRIAVKSRKRTLTYDSLHKMANRLAHAIVAQQEHSKEPIALLLQNDASAIIAILGVLKAGKIYVPLDPAYPRARLTSILENSQASFILTDSENLSLATELALGAGPLLKVDELDERLPTENPGLSISPEVVASIFYTSGSTGQPKGVVQNHRNVLHRIMIDTNSFHISPDDRLSLLSSPSYSVSLRNLFGSLLNGGTLYPFDIEKEGLAHLADWLIQEEITIHFSVPTVFRHFIRGQIQRKDFSMLRLIYLAGEPVTKMDVDLFKKHFSSNCLLVNSLASNEAGIIRQYFIDNETQISTNVVPVGYQVDGKEILVLDHYGREVGYNQIGEIAVKSRYLFPGYWRNPDLTSAAFLPDPKGGDERIFLTGDMGVMRPDGCLVHMGRKDSRVKIRGLRVELEEVEATLRLHPGVRESVVETKTDESEDGLLVAYIVSNQEQAPTATELRRFLQARLPNYMVPSAFVFLDALPLTPNGKVDRRALPTPEPGRPEVETPYAAPRDALELQLTKIWERLLGTRSVGVNDNFFELGGHSLLAVQLVAQIEKALGKHLPPATLFQAPTIDQLASILRQGKWPESWSSLVPIQPGGSKLPFFWVHGDSSNAFLPRYLGPNQPLYGLEHQSQDGNPALYRTVEDIAAHYLDEIRTIQSEGPYFLGGYSFGGIAAFEMAQQLKQQGEDVALLVLLDPPNPGNGKSLFALIPSFPTASTGLTRFRDGIYRHVRDLALLGPQEKLAYFAVRVKGKIQEKRAWISKMLKKIHYKGCLAVGRRLPTSLRSCYILDIYHQARRNYVPKTYLGKTIYIKSKERSSSHLLNWSKLIPFGMEVYNIPGDHVDIIKEPQSRIWAKELKLWIENAQSAEWYSQS